MPEMLRRCMQRARRALACLLAVTQPLARELGLTKHTWSLWSLWDARDASQRECQPGCQKPVSELLRGDGNGDGGGDDGEDGDATSADVCCARNGTPLPRRAAWQRASERASSRAAPFAGRG